MSTFAVTVEQIANIWAHPNADLLDMAQLTSMTYQFVIGKGQFKPGDLVVYFPIDSVLPSSMIESLGLSGKLAGKDKNRIKTVRLRDQISQGVVTEPSAVLPADMGELQVGQDVTEMLGVTRYDPPLPPSNEGKLIRLPAGIGVYDIEGAERYASAVEAYLMDQPVIITEKLEGSHFAASLVPGNQIVISQRNYAIQALPGKQHGWHRVAQTSGIIDLLPEIKIFLKDVLGCPVQIVTVRGEVLGPGVQKNIYKLKDHRVMFFEIEANGEPVDATIYQEIVQTFGLDHAPILASNFILREWLSGQSLAAASNGKSHLNPEVAREGIVIRPMHERRDGSLGRVIIKQRSPEYLAQSDF